MNEATTLDRTILKWSTICVVLEVFFHLGLFIAPGVVFVFIFSPTSSGIFNLIPPLFVLSAIIHIGCWIYASRHLSSLKKKRSHTLPSRKISPF